MNEDGSCWTGVGNVGQGGRGASSPPLFVVQDLLIRIGVGYVGQVGRGAVRRRG